MVKLEQMNRRKEDGEMENAKQSINKKINRINRQNMSKRKAFCLLGKHF